MSFFSFIDSIIKPLGIKFNKNLSHKKFYCLNDNTGKTKFYLNDPSTPHLIKELTPTPSSSLKLDVKGDKGAGFALGSEEQQANACNLVISKNIDYLNTLYKIVTNKKIDRWIATDALKVFPRAGVDLNAYYDRKSLRFFYLNDKKKNKMVYSCDATPVVCHEFGHAFLDTIRPDFWSVQAIEIWSFHEAFGDISSLLFSLQNEELIRYALEETDGNLLKSNVITRIGAEMGSTYFNLAKNKQGLTGDFLRDISVVYNYQNPELLPNKGPDNILINECHSFSRVFSSAFYEIVIRIAEENLKTGKLNDYIESIKYSRDLCARYLLKAIHSVPMTVRFFDALARQILFVDLSEGSKYQEIINKVFSNRNILIQKVKMLEKKTFKEIKKSFSQEKIEVEELNKNKVLKVLVNNSIKILDKRLINLNNNYLYGYEIDVANQKSFYFDKKGRLIDVIEASDNEYLDSALFCLNYLDKNNLIGKNDKSTFEVIDSKIVRKKISCKCGLPNYCDPNAPEYQKPWKPENHYRYGVAEAQKNIVNCDCSEEPKNTENKKCNHGSLNCHSNYKYYC